MPAGFANLSCFCCTLQKISPCLAAPGRLACGVSSVIYSSSVLKLKQALVNMQHVQKETLTIFRRLNNYMVCVTKHWLQQCLSYLSLCISPIHSESSLWIFFPKASLEKEHYCMQAKDVLYITNDLIICMCWLLQTHIYHSHPTSTINLMPNHLLLPTQGLYHSCFPDDRNLI